MLRTTPAIDVVVDPFSIEALRKLLHGESELGSSGLALLKRATSKSHVAELRQELTTLQTNAGAKLSDNKSIKLGIGWYLLGKHALAFDFLEPLSKNGLALFYFGNVCVSLNRFDEAAKHFAAAAKSGGDEVECVLQQVGATRQAGNLQAAESLLSGISKKAVSRADYSFQLGCILADRGDTLGAIEYFERAIDMDPFHSRALFWLASESDRLGHDHEAILLYERALSRPPILLGAVLNLGVLYEDSERYEQAAFCYRRVLEADPQNERARLFLKDINATGDQFYDEEAARQDAKLKHTLSRPLNDFELSVRSRNCLVQLGIVTLEDLTQISEAELLASRNFGETSLKEIRELLAKNGLHIGQNLGAKRPETFAPQADLSPAQRTVLERPISDLNLSVRARKCMSRLNITAIGELVGRTPDELLGSKNFGVTSLNEIRGKLSEFGLALRND